MNKSIFKKIKSCIALMLTSVLFLGNIVNVNAVADTIELGSGEKVTAYLAGVGFQTKVTKSGEFVYCLDRSKATAKNVTAKLVGELDAGFAYIIENGYAYAMAYVCVERD